ncbi:hypothetical protein GB937_006378 [Aspergillus fischeri]|nr:hypothetical protein GB937_006378 [Aspergillus fischeri]
MVWSLWFISQLIKCMMITETMWYSFSYLVPDFDPSVFKPSVANGLSALLAPIQEGYCAAKEWQDIAMVIDYGSYNG